MDKYKADLQKARRFDGAEQLICYCPKMGRETFGLDANNIVDIRTACSHFLLQAESDSDLAVAKANLAALPVPDDIPDTTNDHAQQHHSLGMDL